MDTNSIAEGHSEAEVSYFDFCGDLCYDLHRAASVLAGAIALFDGYPLREESVALCRVRMLMDRLEDDLTAITRAIDSTSVKYHWTKRS